MYDIDDLGSRQIDSRNAEKPPLNGKLSKASKKKEFDNLSLIETPEASEVDPKENAH